MPLVKSLPELARQHEFFIGVASDGSAFERMEIKHKECFCPNMIKYWRLRAVSKYAREAVEFVNLYSRWRGTNRWPAIISVLDLLRVRPEVIARRSSIPKAAKVRGFIRSGKPLSNAGLEACAAGNSDPELKLALEWSRAVNDAIADMIHDLPPFPYVRESLELLESKADVVVVSQTPTEALVGEWAGHGIDKHVRAIAGQELGTKKQHLNEAAGGKYASNHVLMIGDALGDLEAARSNHALFFPINPGHEEESWERFYTEGVPKFMGAVFAGAYEARLIAEFEKLLPSVAPWQH